MQRRNKKSKFGSSGFAPKEETGERIGKVASALANRMGANIQEGKGANFHSTPSGTVSSSNIAGLGSALDTAGKDNAVFNTGAVLPKTADFLKPNEKRAGFGFKLTSTEFSALSRRVKAAGIKIGDSPAEITAAINKVKQGEVRDQIKQVAKKFKTDVQFGEFLVDFQREIKINRQGAQNFSKFSDELEKTIFDQKTKLLSGIWTKGIAYDKYDFGKDFADINKRYADPPPPEQSQSGFDDDPPDAFASETPPFRFPPIPPPGNPNIDPFSPIHDPRPYQPIPNNPTHPYPNPNMPNITPRPGVGPGNKPLPLFPKPGPANPLSPSSPGVTPWWKKPTVPNQPGYPQGVPIVVVVGGVALVIMCIMGVCYVINRHQEQPGTPPVPNPLDPSPSPTGSEPQRNPSRGPTRYQGVDNQTP